MDRRLVAFAVQPPVALVMLLDLLSLVLRFGRSTIHGARYAPWMSHTEEYFSVIKDFLDQQ